MNAKIIARESIEAFEIQKEIEIAAPIDIAFEAVIDDLGPECEMPGGKPFPMTFEARPGGRWYRNTGDDAGHLWGHVQVIKPPTLIEITGPLMMSYPAINHLQYRLTADGEKTRLQFTHRAMGLIPADHRDGVGQGWEYWLGHIRDLAERKLRKGK